MEFKVNGIVCQFDVEDDMFLFWVLCDELGIIGLKYGCGIVQCGVCIVYFDGCVVCFCQLVVGDVGDCEVMMIEGFGILDELYLVQVVWIEYQVVQCGYC